MGKLIPFNLSYVPEEAKKFVLEVLESSHQQGDGAFTAKASVHPCFRNGLHLGKHRPNCWQTLTHHCEKWLYTRASRKTSP
jgi:hypothetical protein